MAIVCQNASNSDFITEVKLVKISQIPLNEWVKLIITICGNSINIYINNQLARTLYLSSTITPGTKKLLLHLIQVLKDIPIILLFGTNAFPWTK